MNLGCSVRKQASDNTLASLSQCRAGNSHRAFQKNLFLPLSFLWKDKQIKSLILNLTKADLLQRRMPCEVGLSGSFYKGISLSLESLPLFLLWWWREAQLHFQLSRPEIWASASFPALPSLLVTPTCGLYCFPCLCPPLFLSWLSLSPSRV